MAFYTEWFAGDPKDAAETCQWLGTYMQLRYQKANSVPPVIDWPMPRGELQVSFFGLGLHWCAFVSIGG